MTVEKTPRTEFGRSLRAELKRQDVSVRALARRMQPDNPEGMRRNLARWLSSEESAVLPSRASVNAVATALGVSGESLLSEEEEEDELTIAAAMFLRAVRTVARQGREVAA